MSETFWLNFATAVGTGLLAGPVIRLNRDKKTLQKLRDSEKQTRGDPISEAMRKEAEEKMRDKIAGWKPWQENCLLIGYMLIAFGAIGRLFVSP